ncbi:MAG: hypothetical protein F4018_17955 [Acidobacteria bacterium]|nr:hypothetical protein [Acidobacteriota bacterium]
MDWTNPLTYGVLLAVATTVGAVAWRIFWWVAKIDPLPEGLRTIASEIRDDTTEIRADIKRIFLQLTPVAERRSPIRLNDFGRKIAESMHARESAKTSASTLLPEVIGMQDFEIDAFAADVVSTRLGDEWPTRIAASAYENGIDQESVRTVLRVELRDELIERVKTSRAPADPGV